MDTHRDSRSRTMLLLGFAPLLLFALAVLSTPRDAVAFGRPIGEWLAEQEAY